MLSHLCTCQGCDEAIPETWLIDPSTDENQLRFAILLVYTGFILRLGRVVHTSDSLD
jgi:hypothetical protein